MQNLQIQNGPSVFPSLKRGDLRAFSILEDIERHEQLPNFQRYETVLLIEDDSDLRQALGLRLSQANLDVVCAGDGLEGFERMFTAEPDLVILDLELPRLSGFKLLHRMRAESLFCTTPTMILTGAARGKDEERAESWGVRRFLRKPVSLRYVVFEALQVLGHA